MLHVPEFTRACLGSCLCSVIASYKWVDLFFSFPSFVGMVLFQYVPPAWLPKGARLPPPASQPRITPALPRPSAARMPPAAWQLRTTLPSPLPSGSAGAGPRRALPVKDWWLGYDAAHARGSLWAPGWSYGDISRKGLEESYIHDPTDDGCPT